jgi:Tfp pilus assembly protein PilN
VRPVNLLPDQRRRVAGTGPANGAYVVVGVLAVLLVMVLGYTLVSNQANSRKTELAKTTQEADALEAKAKTLGAFGSFAAIKEARTASVKQLATGRFDWERTLRELAAVLPRGGWVSEAAGSVTGNAGGAATPATAAPAAQGAAAKPSLNLKGCMPSQTAVASFLVRLRKLYLVEDVSLKESVTASGTAATAAKATVDSCGRLYQFDIAVTFKAAAPTGKEAPRGSDAVPARLGGGS